jgi:hypothetical protein
MREIYKQPEKRYFYDINRSDLEDIYRVFIEEGTSQDITRRVNDSQPYSEGRINLDNWEYNRHAEAEKQATMNIFTLGKMGYNLVIWISPDDGGDVYKEGRLNIEFPTFGAKEWSLYGKHMPLFWDRDESVELAKRLLKSGGISLKEIENTEDLRCQPIGFKMNNIDEWIDKCRELVPEFEKVWQFIENGGDLENQEKIKKDVVKAMILANGDNYYFESLMIQMGNGINADGSHGSSYGGGEKGIVISVNADGTISYRLGSTEGLNFCEKCGCYYSGEKCPLCSKESRLLMAA